MDQKQFVRKCRANGIKVTAQRIVIYKELSRSSAHPSALAIFQKIRKKFPHISFDTVNRTVLTFADMGIIRIVDGGVGGRRFDPDTGPHHHLKCLKCHSIIDFYHKVYDELRLPEKLPARFRVLSKQVVLEGFCQKCNPSKGGKNHEST